MTIIYTEEQERAITSIVEWYGEPARTEFFLAGYAGVGKSTVCSEAIERIKNKYFIENIPTAAYTGKAANVLRKKGNRNAQTIHSLIYTPQENIETGEITFIKNPVGAAALADLIVLDECSMIDNQLADDLRSFKKKILVLGDTGQLPPINGEGAFTNREPDFFLREIHRQAAESPIIYLATLARQGFPLPLGFDSNGVKVLPLNNQNVDENIYNPDTQIICGVHRVRWAVTQLVRKHNGFTEQFPMIGDKIICRKNDKNRGLFNGALGVVQRNDIRPDGFYKINAEIEGMKQKNIICDPFLFRQHFDNGASQYDFKKKRYQMDFGAVLTVHVSQGSGFPHVTLIDNSKSFREHSAKHLYTGITRAESGLVILVPS